MGTSPRIEDAELNMDYSIAVLLLPPFFVGIGPQCHFAAHLGLALRFVFFGSHLVMACGL